MSEHWGLETPELLKVLEDEGLRLTLRNGKLVATGRPAALRNAHLTRLIRERRYDLVAWLEGDHALGIRRLDDQGSLSWGR